MNEDIGETNLTELDGRSTKTDDEDGRRKVNDVVVSRLGP